MDAARHLDGSVAVVTGSSRGIGFAVAAALARAGAAVVVNGRDPTVAEQAAEEIAATGAVTRLSTGQEYHRHTERLHRRGLLDDMTKLGALDPGGPEYVAQLYTFLASELATGISGEIYAGAGCYVGRFPRPEQHMLTWRDHDKHPPWSPAEIAEQVR